LIAIRKVHQGELWIDRGTASRLISSLAERRRIVSSKAERARIESLSPREREVVALVADGMCNKANCKNMGNSDNTVRHHLTSVYSKLDTRDRLELVIYAFRQGVVRVTR
jgi:DNA-binding NarL/FixJ family response regulator